MAYAADQNRVSGYRGAFFAWISCTQTRFICGRKYCLNPLRNPSYLINRLLIHAQLRSCVSTFQVLKHRLCAVHVYFEEGRDHCCLSVCQADQLAECTESGNLYFVLCLYVFVNRPLNERITQLFLAECGNTDRRRKPYSGCNGGFEFPKAASCFSSFVGSSNSDLGAAFRFSMRSFQPLATSNFSRNSASS